MPKPPLPDRIQKILAQPNPAVIATVRADGQPILVATWYLWEDGHVLVNMEESRRRVARLRKDPRVTLTVLSADNWYTYVSLQGRVTALQDDPDLADIDRLSQRYQGKPYVVRDHRRISAWVEIDRWHGWGQAKP